MPAHAAGALLAAAGALNPTLKTLDLRSWILEAHPVAAGRGGCRPGVPDHAAGAVLAAAAALNPNLKTLHIRSWNWAHPVAAHAGWPGVPAHAAGAVAAAGPLAGLIHGRRAHVAGRQGLDVLIRGWRACAGTGLRV